MTNRVANRNPGLYSRAYLLPAAGLISLWHGSKHYGGLSGYFG